MTDVRKDTHLELPRGLVRQAARELKAQFDRCEKIRELGEGHEYQSTKDVWCIVEQLGARRWKATTIEPLTERAGCVSAYGHSLEAAIGSEMRMVCMSKLLQEGRFNERDEARDFVCERLEFRAASIKRL